MPWGEGAARAAEALLRVAGHEVVVRVRRASVGGGEMPCQELTLRPCVLRSKGATAELLVSAGAVGDVGTAAELFGVSARVVADDVVWRVVSFAAVECGGKVVCWRVGLGR